MGPRGQAATAWVLWLTYGSFYFCRTNISAAVPGMESDLGLDIDKEQIGWILASFKLTYGIGQFVNGQLAERVPARGLLAVGMLCSAALNVLFGFSEGFYFLLFVWATNGYMQALGWTPCMRVAANWCPAARRGLFIGIIGTGYQFIAAVTYVVSGQAAEWFGWQFAFHIPAILLTLSAIHMLFFLREAPSPGPRTSPGIDPQPDDEVDDSAVPVRRSSVSRNVFVTLTNPALWYLAVALGLLNACRYGFLDWGITHLKEVHGDSVGKAAVKYAVLPLGGIAGAFVAGWVSDRFFGSRRAPVICILLVALGGLTVAYNHVVPLGLGWTLVTLALVGFTIYGPQVLLVGTAPVDLAFRGAPAAAVGFVNFMGYMGASVGDVVTGSLAKSYQDWRIPVYFWAGCAFMGAVATAMLWNVTARGPAEDSGDEEG
ncbi:MAG: MFS transporter [Planctomycetota bacterium]|nr:MFS transporter [Planctomycetota bacterium]